MKKIIATFCLLMALSASANENIYPLIQNSESRQTLSLNGLWQCQIDPYETGFYNYRMTEDPKGFGIDRKQQNASDLVEYNFDTAPTIQVPGDWNTQAEKWLYYEGTMWYRRKFQFAKNEDKRQFLCFGAVNYDCHIYLNGKKIGYHEGGFTSFNIEITNQIKSGDNSLVIKVDNKRRLDAVPTTNTDWYNYGGITRSVYISELPKCFIRDYTVSLKKESNQIIRGSIQLDGKEAPAQIIFEIPELKIRKILDVDKDGAASFEIKSKPTLWSPENPHLYNVHISTSNDKIDDKIGFRTIETKGKKILLNGKEIFCRGICIHEEAPFRSGRAWSREDAQTLLGWAKELGCNFVRLAHYPHNETMIREAEKMGLLVWSEIPVYWTIQWKNKETLENAKNQLSEMIVRDKNRANVIIWSIANETPVSDERNFFLKSLADQARSLDPTRLVAAAMEKHAKDKQTMTLKDPAADFLDVLSFNQYIGWYDGLPEKCERVNWTFEHDKPVFISEFGGGALQGLHGAKESRWTEEFQEDLYIKSIEMLKRMEGLSGCTPWLLMDFRSPKRMLGGIQDGFNRKGLYSNKGIKKKAFFVMQKWYEEIKNSDKTKK